MFKHLQGLKYFVIFPSAKVDLDVGTIDTERGLGSPPNGCWGTTCGPWISLFPSLIEKYATEPKKL